MRKKTHTVIVKISSPELQQANDWKGFVSFLQQDSSGKLKDAQMNSEAKYRLYILYETGAGKPTRNLIPQSWAIYFYFLSARQKDTNPYLVCGLEVIQNEV